GRAHRNGKNACFAVADKLAQISKLTDYRKDVTVSVGWMSGGQNKYNIVCGHAEAKVDTRFATLRDGRRLHEQMDKILRAPHPSLATTNYEIEDDCPAFSISPLSKPFVEKYRSIIKKIEGKDPGAKNSGGAADTNYLSREGLVVFDGLGAAGGKIHTADEYLTVASLESRAEAFAQFLQFLNDRP
ncbi:MAG: hypothetical protein C5B49_14470, partial [Bdellovibrio sp.]